MTYTPVSENELAIDETFPHVCRHGITETTDVRCVACQNEPLARETAKIVILPVDHFVGPRLARRTWAASLAPRGSDSPSERVLCQHTHGHRTIESATKCGDAMWRRLP